MEISSSESISKRPCVKLIIAAVEYAPVDESGEALEFGLELARSSGEFSAVDDCRLAFESEFYCDDRTSTACELRRAFRN